MIEIPEKLRSLFTGTVREREGRYVIEVPASEVEHEALTPGQRYRVALVEASGESESTSERTQSRSRSQSPRGGRGGGHRPHRSTRERCDR
jgi:hypothetical protein